MKKAEIKRRKRVVPAHLAGDDQASVYTTESAEEARSSMPPPASPYPDMSNHPQQEEMLEAEPHPPGGPIPVDFTSVFRSRQPPSETDSNPRKRSFSAATDDVHPTMYSHAQNVASPPKYQNLDPSLSGPSEAQQQQEQADKVARRKQLQAEAERMRVMLLEKERELAEMNEEG